MTDKYEYMSKEWLAKLEAIIGELVEQSRDELSGIGFAMNQIYTDVPEHLAQGSSARAGWWFRIKNGEFEFGIGEIPDANIKLIGPYATMLPLARLVMTEDPTALEQTNATIHEGVSDGTISYYDDGQGFPAPLAPAHDLIAKHTA